MAASTREALERLRADMDCQADQAACAADLEIQLQQMRQRLAEAEAQLREAPSWGTPSGFHQSWLDDPSMPAAEKHRLARNPAPSLPGRSPRPPSPFGGRQRPGSEAPRAPPPQTPHWISRFNPLSYLRTPFKASTDSPGFEFRRTGTEVRAEMAEIPEPLGFFFFFFLSLYAFPPKGALGYEARTPRIILHSWCIHARGPERRNSPPSALQPLPRPRRMRGRLVAWQGPSEKGPEDCNLDNRASSQGQPLHISPTLPVGRRWMGWRGRRSRCGRTRSGVRMLRTSFCK